MPHVRDDQNAELRSLYDSITLEVIQRWIAEKRPEDLNIEFKRLEKHYAGQLAKAMSGFANSAGGVIVWGVGTSKNDAGIDCASSAVPIEGVESICTKLKEHSLAGSDPPVRGVEHRAILMEGDSGFIKTLVPASQGAHRALQGHGRFYRRSELGHHPMTTLEIADLFGRQPHPELCPKLTEVNAVAYHSFSPGALSEESTVDTVCAMHLVLENSGRGIARFPAVRFVLPSTRFSVDSDKVDGSLLQRVPLVPSSAREFMYAGGADVAIHVGEYLRVRDCFRT